MNHKTKNKKNQPFAKHKETQDRTLWACCDRKQCLEEVIRPTYKDTSVEIDQSEEKEDGLKTITVRTELKINEAVRRHYRWRRRRKLWFS